MLTRIFILVSLLTSFSTKAQVYLPEWNSLDKRPVPEWYKDAKFGIFIHWGVYSVPSWAYTVHDENRKDWKHTIHYAEWYWRLSEDVAPFPEHHKKVYGDEFRYQDFVSQFKAEYFDPTQWADLIENSGAKYVVLTSKHHDGFALWPSKQSWNWNSVDVGPHRDIVGELGKEIKKKGLHMGYYYSLYEWYNPTYLENQQKYVDEHMIPQLKDLVTKYKPEVLWTDGEWDHSSKAWKSEEFLAWLFNESPVKEFVAVNDRWGKETRGVHGGYYTTEYGEVNGVDANDNTTKHTFEECRGIGRSFGYNRMEKLNDYLSSDSLVLLLVELVSKGGNLLLNIGPKADGTIPVIMQERLIEIGKWLKINGDAIYGTSKWDNVKDQKISGAYFTKKGNDLYVILKKWHNSDIVVKNITKTGKVSLLGYNGRIDYKLNNENLIIIPPAFIPLECCSYAWVFKIQDAF